MQAEILGGEAAAVHQHHGQGVAQRQRHQGRGRRRQPVRAGLGYLRHGQADRRGSSEEAVRPLGDADHRNALALAVDQRIAQFAALSRVRYSQQGHILAQHPEVAVAHLGRVHEETVGAGRGEGGGDLAANVAGFAHAGDDQIAGPRQDDLDRLGDVLADGVFQRGQGLDVQPGYLAGAGDHGGGIGGQLFGHAGEMAHPCVFLNHPDRTLSCCNCEEKCRAEGPGRDLMR